MSVSPIFIPKVDSFELLKPEGCAFNETKAFPFGYYQFSNVRSIFRIETVTIWKFGQYYLLPENLPFSVTLFPTRLVY